MEIDLDAADTSDERERSLDPETPAEWDAFRATAHRLVDRLIEDVRTLRKRPCWRPPPSIALSALRAAPSANGVGVEAAVASIERWVLPFGTGNLHPRFWAWALGAGNIAGMLGEWVAASMNANVFAGDQGPVHLEQAVLGWFREWFAFPFEASGILTTGASMANLLGLAIAEHWATGGKARREGPEASWGLRLYASTATHNSIIKSAQLLGLGSDSVRAVRAVRERIDMSALSDAVRSDRQRGLRPFCLVANVGTVGTGAMDPIDELRAYADAEGLWLHVDGAIGAVASLSPTLRPMLGQLGRADSLAFDLHKWAQVPYEAGCLLVRDEELHRSTFATEASYLGNLSRGFSTQETHAFNDRSPFLSRSDRALKIWTTFQALGTKRLAALFDQNVAQARYLADRIDEAPELERLAPVTLNIVCFRFAKVSHRDVDRVNQEIVVRLQESGFCMLSPFRLDDAFCLRVSLSNHRTRRSDLEELLARVIAEGTSLTD